MISFAPLLSLTIFLVITLLLWKGGQLVWSHIRGSPLRSLRGPKGTNFIHGNSHNIFDYNVEMVESWVKEYGHTFRIKGFFGSDQLLTIDTRAIGHILIRSTNDYKRPPAIRHGLSQIFGEGLIVAEGAQHRQQRRIMNPAFGPVQIRELTGTFLAKALRLRELWSAEITKDSGATVDGKRIDIIPWMNRMTLDTIGLTGFNYDFGSLDSSGHTSELGKVFSVMFAASQGISTTDVMLRAGFPILRLIPSIGSHKLRAAQLTMIKIGQQLLTKAKAETLELGTPKSESSDLRGRDLLSLLVKANMATHIPETRRVPDKDVIAQVPTFFVAGHETTSTSVAWALYALTQAPDVQTKLRDELLSVDTDNPSMDELMALSYLDAVAREVLRLHAPVPSVARMAMKNDVLPLEKPYVDKYNVVHDTIMIAKGDQIVIPILTINRSREIWGPDAFEFNPERWANIPEAASRVPGVWSHLLTFTGGPRACIGYRFSLVEFKVILFTLVRAFEFQLAVPAGDISCRTTIVRHPVLRSDPMLQAQLPLLVRPYRGM